MDRTTIDLTDVPDELKQLKQWVTWQHIERDGELSKFPTQNGGRGAKSSDPKTWVGFDEAVYFLELLDTVEGIGFMFSRDDPYCGVDLDGCRDPETGAIAIWASEIIERFDTYCEVSPSGTGVKLICKARSPFATGRNKKLASVQAITSKTPGLEIYDHKRFWTFTGLRLIDKPNTVNECQEAMNWLCRRYESELGSPDGGRTREMRRTEAIGTPPADDQEILDRAFASANGHRIRQLFGGSRDGYQSASEADLALAAFLAFWTGPDQPRLESLMRQSQLYRDKWDEQHGDQTYLEMTVARAVESTRTFFNWTRPNKKKPKSEPISSGNITIEIESAKQTKAKLTVEVVVKSHGEVVDIGTVSTAVSSKKNLERLIVDLMEGVEKEHAEAVARKMVANTIIRGKRQAEREIKQREEEGETIAEILASFIPRDIDLLEINRDGGAISSIWGTVTARRFLDMYTREDVLQAIETASDAPQDESGQVSRSGLYAALNRELRILWGTMTSQLKLSDDHTEVADLHDAINQAWKRVQLMGIARERKGEGQEMVQLKKSLARCVREMRDEGRIPLAWDRIHPSYDAWVCKDVVLSDGEILPVGLAMRFDLIAQAGVRYGRLKSQRGMMKMGRERRIFDDANQPRFGHENIALAVLGADATRVIIA